MIDDMHESEQEFEESYELMQELKYQLADLEDPRYSFLSPEEIARKRAQLEEELKEVETLYLKFCRIV